MIHLHYLQFLHVMLDFYVCEEHTELHEVLNPYSLEMEGEKKASTQIHKQFAT